MIIDRTSVHRVIKLVVDSPKLSLERYSAVSQIWDAVMGLAEDFTESAVNSMYLLKKECIHFVHISTIFFFK